MQTQAASQHMLGKVEQRHGSGPVKCDEQPAIAPRLVWLRDQLRKVENSLQQVSDELVQPLPEACDPIKPPCKDDVIGVVGDLEAIANDLTRLAERIGASVGSVSVKHNGG